MKGRGTRARTAGHRQTPVRRPGVPIGEALARASELAGLGKTGEAERLCRDVLAVMPRLGPAHFVAGEIAEANGNRDSAIDNYRNATRLQPDYVPAWLNLGVCLRERGDHDGAIAAYERAVALDPRSVQAHNNLASAYVTVKRFGPAIGAFERALKLRPNSVEIRRSLASVCSRAGQARRAIELALSALALDERDAKAWAILGRCHQVEGDFAQAEAALLRALAIDPADAAANSALASGKRDPEQEQAQLGTIEAILDDGGAAPDQLPGLNFAAARLHERRKDYDRAFARYRTANDLRADSTVQQAHIEPIVDAMIASFSPAVVAAAPPGDPTRQPVFIVGMPRSGTTLVEQIVASHPDAAAAGELTALMDLVKPQARIDAGVFAVPDEAERASMAGQYLEALVAGRGEARRITDKLPFNFINLGMIHLLFPDAAIIHCRRDPMDTCLSCYCQNFLEELWFSTDLATLGAYYRSYRRMMDHWTAVLPRRILEVDYERVTAEPEAAIRQIIGFCGLEWDEACLAPHQREGSVSTASLWQVRQPIYRSSVAKWKRYDRHLQPLRDALGDLVVDDPTAATD